MSDQAHVYQYKTQQQLTIKSPDQRTRLEIGVDSSLSHFWYALYQDGECKIKPSKLTIYDDKGDNKIMPHGQITITSTDFDEVWEHLFGEQRYIRNQYNEIALCADDYTIRFRLFNDGLGFRYELGGDGPLVIANEGTEFNIDLESSAWWIPALGINHYEHQFQNCVLPEVGIAHTPLTVELPTRTYLSIHEAALYDYGAMNVVPTEFGMVSTVTPLKDGPVARVSLPFNVPWRTVTLSDTAHQLMSSKIMLNLNEPSKIDDTSWIQPNKFLGIWWGMFINRFTWGSGEKHGATTANAIRYLNACKKLGISALLIEGWNVGWDGDWTNNGNKMDHMQPYSDFDIQTVTSYAHSLGIDIVGHHETSGDAIHYEWELPEAYDYYRSLGVRYVKTGYVNPRMNGEFHSSQAGVNHYQKTVELAAERKMMLDIHEPVKGSGIERTWPNLLTREGVMGQEYEGGAILPQHATVLPYTRSLAGPFDYTPGLFKLRGTDRDVQTTLARQLAFYVTMFSPLGMLADLPEHYIDHPAFRFLATVPTVWEESIPLDGVIGDYFLIARKDLHSSDWYVGAVTDENSRTIKIACTFLPAHTKYTAVIYKDDKDAHWQDNPEAYAIDKRTITSESNIDIFLAPGGGCAVQLTPYNDVPSPYPTS